MRYLITSDKQEPFITNWYEYENNFVEGINMIVYDLFNCCYSTDGDTWLPIVVDHL